MKAISKANLPAQTGGAQGGPDLLDFDVIVSLLFASFLVLAELLSLLGETP